MPSDKPKARLSPSESQRQVEEKIDQFTEANRDPAKKIHNLILQANPDLKPRLWYGMPGYAKSSSSPVLIFFREDEAYMTFGLTEKVRLTPESKNGNLLMPCAWFFTSLNSKTENAIADIVTQATNQ